MHQNPTRTDTSSCTEISIQSQWKPNRSVKRNLTAPTRRNSNKRHQPEDPFSDNHRVHRKSNREVRLKNQPDNTRLKRNGAHPTVWGAWWRAYDEPTEISRLSTAIARRIGICSNTTKPYAAAFMSSSASSPERREQQKEKYVEALGIYIQIERLRWEGFGSNRLSVDPCCHRNLTYKFTT